MTEGRKPGFGKWALSIGAALAIFAPRPASADIFNVGDIMNSFGNVFHYDHDLHQIGLLVVPPFPSGNAGGSTFDRTGNFYVTSELLRSGNTIAKFDSAGNLVSPAYFTGSSDYSSILYSGSGNFYAGNAGIANEKNVITQFDAAEGAPTGTFLVAGESNSPFDPTAAGANWIDLGANLTTFYYTSLGKHVLRYDMIEGQLSDLNSTPLPGLHAEDLRILPNGEVLVADYNMIVLLDAAGNVIKTYNDFDTHPNNLGGS